MTRPLRIAQFGTFEVENYGDLLFPLILEHALRSRLGDVQLELYSPLSGPFPADPSVMVRAIDGATLAAAEGLDALVIGGGDLISFSERVAPIYDDLWKEPISPHAACWALPLIHRPVASPVAWNAPGVPHAFSIEQSSIVWDLCAEIDYLSVRDEPSREHLAATGVASEIAVVPDTALLLPRLLSGDAARDLARPRLEPLGLASGGYVVFQISPHLLERLDVEATKVARLLDRVARELGVRILLLPIGYCHDDHAALSMVREAAKTDLAFLEPRLRPLEIAALVAESAGFIGSSYHGAVTALAYDRPFLMVNSGKLTKLDGLARWTGRQDAIAACWEELALRAPKLAPDPGAEERRRALCARVDVHFDRLAEVVSSGPCQRPASDAGSVAEHLRELRTRLLSQELVLQRERSHAERAATTHERVIERLRERIEKRRRSRFFRR